MRPTQLNLTMKTKLTLLAATLLVGFASTSAQAIPSNWSFANGQTSAKSGSVKPVRMSCCDTKTSYRTAPGGRGLQVNKSIVCNTGCSAPRAAKNCTAAERKQCAN
ncbi:hypothetical protein SAMN02745166_01120 [Prosthecobacter debontii]|uniref:Uncharacterized protein n=2 Tax=Prosthecobacter debontii TaxID=48467 RepID=A0A1T4X6Q9_9BACT|nr:hypothetical protein SAMN02745166_01120 [Prosthecobacter debontii]